ncbi:MAG: ThuA domain-containing protein [Bacteroidales bacterium]|nr:ThuA domain-containing protein [Bacteroidales bacterium]
MKKIISIWSKLLIIPIVLLLTSTLFNACQQQPKHKVLIVTGQNTFNWEESSEALKQILENSGLFRVNVHISPKQGEDMSGFNPNFSNYDLVVLNYNGDPWPEQTGISFVDYIKAGGGIVVFQSANSAFPDWKEYHEIIGLGGWKNRDEMPGNYLYWEEDEFVTDTSQGYGKLFLKAEAYQVVNRDTAHPVTRGLPEKWMHADDIIINRLKGPAQNLKVLSTAFSDSLKDGTGRHEPILFTVEFGEGRIFHTAMGYTVSDEEKSALECVGFITTFQRGAEWAATGSVTQSVPVDFPNAVSTHHWENFLPLSLDELMAKISRYKIGMSRKYISDLSNRIRKSDGSPETLLEFEKKMLDFLNSEATIDSKNFICKELSWMGSGKSIPTLEKLAKEEATAEMAAFALERLKAE